MHSLKAREGPVFVDNSNEKGATQIYVPYRATYTLNTTEAIFNVCGLNSFAGSMPCWRDLAAILKMPRNFHCSAAAGISPHRPRQLEYRQNGSWPINTFVLFAHHPHRDTHKAGAERTAVNSPSTHTTTEPGVSQPWVGLNVGPLCVVYRYDQQNLLVEREISLAKLWNTMKHH